MPSIHSLAEADLALEPFWPSNVNRPAYTTEQIERFMEYIGDPQNKPRSIHIAGTSGKTSTAYYAAALLKQAGKKVGMLTSPHIEGLNERVQIDLKPLAEDVFCKELSVFLDIVERSGITLTYAELLYAFGYWEFERQHVDYIVIEVGMGGLLDATNVIDRPDKVAVITDIGLDHTNVLGDTIQQIAAHKAGIIRLKNTVFCHRQSADIMDVFQQQARKQQADLHVIEQDEHTPTNLPLFQQRNFSLALCAVSFTLQRKERIVLSDEQIKQAAAVHIPARMEVFDIKGKTVVLDNAHNPQKLRALCESLDAQFPDKSIAFLVAFAEGRGRNVDEMVNIVAPIADHLIVTALPPGPKLRKGREVEEVMAVYRGENKQAVSDYKVALHELLARPESVIVITGSTYLLEYIRPLVCRSAALHRTIEKHLGIS